MSTGIIGIVIAEMAILFTALVIATDKRVKARASVKSLPDFAVYKALNPVCYSQSGIVRRDPEPKRQARTFRKPHAVAICTSAAGERRCRLQSRTPAKMVR